MPEQFILQQALFGYRDGHNMLATSTELGTRVRQFLATITDSSGPDSFTGFEGAFTGVPLPQTDFYALFQTWPAPEMPRPGCVWSHVILIQLADLARIPELVQLSSLFARPTLPIVPKRYEQSLALDSVGMKQREMGRTDLRRSEYLIHALYEHPNECVVILDEENASWENTVFGIWTQQWPRLRREFTFSTGSLGDRSQAGVTFDLQIAPITSTRLWRKTGAPARLLSYTAADSEPNGGVLPQWVQVATEDLTTASARRFRKFLFDFGSDIGNPRVAFKKLATLYSQVHSASGAGWKDLLCTVAEIYPSQTDAVRLKRQLSALPVSLDSNENLERAWGIVSFLLDSEQSDAYPSSAIDFSDSAVPLWNGKRDQMIALLTRLVQKKHSDALVSLVVGISNAVESVSLRSLAASSIQLVPLVIKHNPTLAFEIDTWKLSDQIQLQVFNALESSLHAEEDWGKVVGAMLVAATSVSVRDAIAKAGPYAMPGAFRWLEHHAADEVLPSQAWRDALSPHAVNMLARITNLQPRQLALSAWFAPSGKVKQILSAKREDVQQIADVFPSVIPVSLRIPTAFLLLSIGLKENSDCATTLVLKSFFIVHDALATSAHSMESWSLLSSELPTIGWFSDWDRCKRLRRAVNAYLTLRGECHRLWEYAKTPIEQKIARKVTGIDRDDWLSEFVD